MSPDEDENEASEDEADVEEDEHLESFVEVGGSKFQFPENFFGKMKSFASSSMQKVKSKLGFLRGAHDDEETVDPSSVPEGFGKDTIDYCEAARRGQCCFLCPLNT